MIMHVFARQDRWAAGTAHRRRHKLHPSTINHHNAHYLNMGIFSPFLYISLYFSLFLSVSLCLSLFISVYLCFSLFLCQFCKTQLPQFRWGWQRRQLQRQTLGILATWLIRFCLSPSSFLFLFLFRVNSLRYGAPLDSIFLPQLQLSEWNKLAELDPPVLIQPAPGSTFLITKHPADTQADK